MSKVLVLGSSHTGALRRAAPAFRAAFPDVDLDFFGTRGPVFKAGRVSADGIFTPGYGKGSKEREFTRTVNGAETVDLNPYDAILVVGFRFDLGTAASLLLDHDVLEGTDTGKEHALSEAFLTACINEVSDKHAATIKACLGPDRNYVLTLGPYPAASIGERAETYELARVIDNFRSHPDAPHVFAYWQKAVQRRIADLGYGYLAQPEETVAGPYVTLPEFAQDAADGGADALGRVDHRHMNADFGLRVLTKFATDNLGRTVAAA